MPFLKLMGIVAGGWQMARAALAAEKQLTDGRQVLPRGEDRHRALLRRPRPVQAPGLRNTVVNGAPAVMALSEEQFLGA